MSWYSGNGPRLSYFLREIDHRADGEDLPLLAVSTKFGVVRKNELANSGARADSLENYKVVVANDIVLNRFNAYRGALGLAQERGLVSPDYSTLTPIRGVPRYFDYWLRSAEVANAMKSNMGGLGAQDPDSSGFSRVNTKELLKLKVHVCDVEQQRSIADFLDRELAQIDEILESTMSLISKLKVKQRAVIWAQLGLKAQSPDTGSRFSPVFEDFQNRWPLVPFKTFAKQRKFLVGSNWSSYQLLSLTRGGVITRDPDSGVGKFPTEFDGYQVVEPMDIVFCLFDVAETPRTIGLVKEAGMITAAYTRYQLDIQKVDPEWLELLFIAIDDEKLFEPFYTGLRNTVPKEVLRSTLLPLPPLSEQATCVEIVKQTNERLAGLISKASVFEDKLRQRRDALISAAATGKIIVRGKI